MLWGVDVSHHNGTFDMGRAKREGFTFAFVKATDGASFVDSLFEANLRNARVAGLLVAAYHYQRGSATAAAQVQRIISVVPRTVPIILDVEAHSGDLNLTRDILTRLQREKYRTPLLYLPRWYWQQIGRPSLTGLPPLWSSRYPDRSGGYATQIYQRVPAGYWDSYGGNPVAVLQFTASATVAGKNPIDANAYRGTYEELAALLTDERDDMFTDEDRAALARLSDLFPPIDDKAIEDRKGHSAGSLTNAVHSLWERVFFDPEVTELGKRVVELDAKLERLLARLDRSE